MFTIKVPHVIANYIRRYATVASIPASKAKALSIGSVISTVAGGDALWYHDGTVRRMFGSLAPVSVTGSSVTLTEASHANRIVTLNRAAGIAVTLAAATGTGNRYTLVVGTTFTGAATVKVASALDFMIGVALLNADGGATTVGFATANTGTVATEDDTIDMFGTANSTGGFKGEVIELIDVASATYSVRVWSEAGGTEATPFSATV